MERQEFTEWLVDEAKKAVESILPATMSAPYPDTYQQAENMGRLTALDDALRRYNPQAFVDFYAWQFKRFNPDLDEREFKENMLEDIRSFGSKAG